MPFQKLSSTDAFVVTDLDGAPRATGVVRRARKILPDGARLLARSTTYAWAVLGEQVSGASAGVNAEDDAAGEAVAAFVAEVLPQVAAGTLSLDAAKGVGTADLAPLDEVDARSGLRRSAADHRDDLLLAAGLVAAAAAVTDLDGRTVVVEGAGAAGRALAEGFAGAGATVVEPGEGGPLSTEADVLVCGSRTGLVDHAVAASLPHRLVVPVGPVPVTARGLAVAHRRGVVVLPDFVTTAGPLVGWTAEAGTADDAVAARAAERIGALVAECCAHPENPTLGGCALAEAFLSTWQEQLPFGRPMA